MFTNTVRYIDDLLTINNPSFEVEIASIYPPELSFKKTTESANVVSYLDINITISKKRYVTTISKKRYVTTIYDKRDIFNFNIVIFMDSNIPNKPACGVYISHLVRVGCICEKYDAFVERNMMITSRLIQQGFRYTKLCDYFKKFSRRYKSIFNKYGVSVRQHIMDGICQPLCGIRTLSKNITMRQIC